MLGNPSCLVSKAATITSCSTTGTAPSAHVVCRYGDAWGAVVGQCWRKPACHPRPRRPTSTRRQVGWQGRRHATCPCLCWWGAARAVGWRWPANDQQPVAPWCSNLSAGETGCLGADAGLVSWSVPSGTPPDGVRLALDAVVPFAASSQRGTSRPPWQAQLMGSAEFWTRRRRPWCRRGR